MDNEALSLVPLVSSLAELSPTMLALALYWVERQEHRETRRELIETLKRGKEAKGSDTL